MSTARSVAAIVLAVLAALGAALLVSMQYGLVAEYGGSGTTILALAVIPIGVALLSALMAGGGRSSKVGVLAFTVLVAIAMVAAIPLGTRAHDRQTLEDDRNFTCNGPNAEIVVDERVDAAFHEFPHPAPLYGPVEGSRYGCTAGIDGPADETFAQWREALLTSGWTVAHDQARVTVTQGDLVAVLSRDGETALLRITAGDPAS
jgi:hypothetical protein